MIILVDQDGPLADFFGHFSLLWGEKYPNGPFPRYWDPKHFNIEEDYPESFRDEAKRIYHRPGFFKNIPPIYDGVIAVHTMLSLGHEVYICTTPHVIGVHCFLEKVQWVENHLGRKFVERLIFTNDKTLIHGDILIDDKPKITGALAPAWKHFLFECSHNRHVSLGETTADARINWQNWRAVLNI